MKKLPLFVPLILLALFFAPPVHAQQLCPDGTDGECTDVGGVTYECDTSQTPYTCKPADAGTGNGNIQTGGACKTDGDCEGNLACIHGTCQLDPSLEDSGTAGSGGSCGQPDANGNPVECPGDQTCVNGTCQGATGNTSPGSPGTGSGGFVPLAPIPGLDSAVQVNSSGIATFLNTLYKFLIGIAAVLAVVEIIWGGLEIATKDSVQKNRDGKSRIWQALLGLALVLSPVLVFTIINPSILNLNANLPTLNLNQYSGMNFSSGGTASNLNQAPGGNPGSGTPPANGCNTATGGSEYQTVSCSTNQAAQNYLAQNCPNNGVLTNGNCTGGFNPNGSCISGQYPSVTCSSPSSQSFTFVNLGTGDQAPSIQFEPTYNMTPITSSKAGVDAFVRSCSTQQECFPAQGEGSAPVDNGVCPANSYSFKTPYSNPHCFTSTLICVGSSDVSSECAGQYVLQDN